MSLLQSALRPFSESALASFGRSNIRSELGVGVSVLIGIACFSLGVMVSNPGATFGTLTGAFGDLLGLSTSYGLFALVSIAFWLASCMIQPFTRSAKANNVVSIFVWRLIGAVLLGGITAPFWLWASFALDNPLALKSRGFVEGTLGLTGFSGMQFMVVASMVTVALGIGYYAMVQHGSTVFASRTPWASDEVFATQPNVFGIVATKFALGTVWLLAGLIRSIKVIGQFVFAKFNSTRASAAANKTMADASQQARARVVPATVVQRPDRDEVDSQSLLEEVLGRDSVPAGT